MKKTTAIYNIGAILSLSGEASQDAHGIRDGLELVAHELQNEGKSINIHYIDDKSDIETSVRSIDNLIREHNIQAIIGPTWANQVDSFSPIIDQERILTFAPAVASDSVIRSSKFLLFGSEKNIYKQSALKDFFIKNKIKKIGVIISQDKWGVSHLVPIKNAAIHSGSEVVFIEQLIPHISSFGKKYIREAVDRSLAVNPDVVIWSGYEGEADVLADYILEKELSIPLIGDQLLMLGQRGERLQKYQGNLYVFSHHFSPNFSKVFESYFNKKPTLYSDNAYDSLGIVIDIISKNPLASSEELIKKLKDKDYYYEGASGIFNFDDHGDIKTGGRWVVEKV